MGKKVTFYFMRHAETYLNKYERMQGWSNAPLTEKGIADCHASGRGLAMIKFDAVYTSDLQRTKDTAQIILSENKMSSQVPLVEKYAFRELFFGHFEGLPVMDVWPKLMEASSNDGNHHRHFQLLFDELRRQDPAGEAEDYMTFWRRVEKGLYELLEVHKNTDHHVLVVSHGLALNAMLQAIVPNYKFPGGFRNASVSKVTYENGQFHLEYINSVDHFKY